MMTTYVKPSVVGAGDLFGYRLALSADGTTLAVGAYGESSNATGVAGDPLDNSATLAGAVYVFVRNGGTWVQQAYLKASNTETGDVFGYAVAISANGNRLAVGAPDEDSAATTIDGDGTNNNANSAGAVYVFARSGTTWAQEAYVKASNAEAGDNFGDAVALSGDGVTLAVGAWSEDSAAIGPGADPTSNAALESGAVYVFTRSPTAWSQQIYLKASNTNASDNFGIQVALSLTGNQLAVAATGESSGVIGNPLDNSQVQAGAVYTFTRAGTAWVQDGYVKASNVDGGDFFGYAIALSADGLTLAVTAEGEDGPGVGVGAPQTEGAGQAGAAYVFIRTGAAVAWMQQAYIKATNTEADDRFGRSVALAPGGKVLVVGAVLEDSAATGRDGDASNNSATDSGAVYVYRRNDAAWAAESYLKATNTGAGDQFGHSVGVATTGTPLAVGAFNEDAANETAAESGAVYIFE
ncbi:MAG: FG-GAP repeat protein [Deltaproteobacteria bacterium]|nr:FG-GAP repeat protein [Deltaproteobacteria bacterium]